MSKIQMFKEKALDTFAALPPRDRILAVGLIVSTFWRIGLWGLQHEQEIDHRTSRDRTG